MDQKDRVALIAYRMQQAKHMSETAKLLLTNNELATAVNRIYYGMFYALTALALQYQFETSKHHQLLGWFNREFISTHKVEMRYGSILRNAFQSRTKGDYDAFISFDIKEVDYMIKEMEQFITMVDHLLNEKK